MSLFSIITEGENSAERYFRFLAEKAIIAARLGHAERH